MKVMDMIELRKIAGLSPLRTEGVHRGGYKIEYDQIPPEEESDTFPSFHHALQFAEKSLNGNYTKYMDEEQLRTEMEKNGYFLIRI